MGGGGYFIVNRDPTLELKGKRMGRLQDVLSLAQKASTNPWLQKAWKYLPPLAAGAGGYAGTYDPDRAERFAEPFAVPGLKYVDPTALGVGLSSAIIADPHGWAKRFGAGRAANLSIPEAVGRAALGKGLQVGAATAVPAVYQFGSRAGAAMEKGTEGLTSAMTEVPQTLLRTTRTIERKTGEGLERLGKSTQATTEFFDKLRSTEGQKEMLQNGLRLAKSMGKDLVATREGKVLVGAILLLSGGWLASRSYQSHQLHKAQQAALQAQQLQAAFFKRQLAKAAE